MLTMTRCSHYYCHHYHWGCNHRHHCHPIMMNALFGKDKMECWQWPALPSGQTLCQWWRPCTDRGNSVITIIIIIIIFVVIIVVTIVIIIAVIIIKIVVILVIANGNAVKIITRNQNNQNHQQLVISFIGSNVAIVFKQLIAINIIPAMFAVFSPY